MKTGVSKANTSPPGGLLHFVDTVELHRWRGACHSRWHVEGYPLRISYASAESGFRVYRHRLHRAGDWRELRDFRHGRRNASAAAGGAESVADRESPDPNPDWKFRPHLSCGF